MKRIRLLHRGWLESRSFHPNKSSAPQPERPITKRSIALLLALLSLACSWSIGVTPTVAAQAEKPIGCTREWYDAHAVAASILGIEGTVLYQALDEGRSIADIAVEVDVDQQLIIDALVDVEGGLVRKMQRGGCLSDTEADAWIAGLPEKMLEFVAAKGAIDDAGQPQDKVIFLPLLMN